VGTAAALAVACLGILTLDANGLSSEDSYTKEFDSIVGQKVLTAHGLSDQSAPLMIVANSDKAADVAQALSAVPGLGEPSQPAIKDGVAFIAAPLDSDASSPASFTAVKQARSAVHAVPGSDALVGGATAFLLDVEKASHRDNLVIIPIVLLVVLLVLMVLLRAVTAPLILVATVVLSFGAALGISSLLFHYVFGFAGADASFPLFVFVFLVALGIDYNIFLMTRVREEAIRRDARHGAIVGMAATGGVITSAGFVLAGTFAVLATIPSTFLTELGFAVAFGILLDTIVVRLLLVTALNLDVGRWMWWPSKLAQKPDPAPGELRQERTGATVPG
jgi:RND superfamily putative drug exporter